MANSFKQSQQEALALIKEVEAEIIKLDKLLVDTATKLNQSLKGGGFANLANQLKQINIEMAKFNTLVSQQNGNMAKLNQAQKNFNNSTNEIKSKIPTLRQMANAQNSLGNAYDDLVRKQKKARDEVRRLTVEQGKNSRETRRAQREYNRYSKQVDRANKSTQSFSRKGLASVGRGFRSLLGAFGIVGGIQIFRSLVKNVFELTKTFDGLGFALERVAGDSQAAAESQRFLLDISERFGVELISTTNRWIKFLAAAKQSGVTLKDTEDIFRTMAKVSGVLGLKTDELTGIYLALEQMLSKGKVTTEELRRQLGERLPGAMGIMAQAVGVTVSELDKMLKKGEVLSAEVLPKFAKAVELAYSLENVDNVQTLVAEQNRLTTAWQNFVKSITEGDSAIKGVFGYLLITLREMVNLANDFFGGKSVSLQKEIIAASDLLKSNLDEMAEKELMLEGFALRRQRDEQKAIIETLRIKKGTSKEAIEQAEEEYRQILDKLQKHEEAKDAIIKEYAVNNVEQSKKEFEEQTRLYEEFIAKEKLLEADFKGDKGFYANKFGKDRLQSIFGTQEINGIIIDSKDAFNRAFESIEDNLGDATAKWNLFKKLIEETKVNVPDPDKDKPKGGKKSFKVDEEKKALFELEKLRQQSLIDQQQAIAENEDFIIEVRKNARERQLEEEKNMVDLIYDYETEVLEDKAKFEGKTEKDIANQKKLIQQESINDKLDLNKKYYADLLSIVKSYNQAELQEIKQRLDDEELIRDEKVIAKRKELQEEGSLDAKEIEEEVVKFKNKLYIEDTKNFIRELIAKKEAELKATDNPELQKALRRQIADLEESLANVGNASDETSKKVNSFFEQFQTKVFSETGFDFLGKILMDFEAFEEAIEKSEKKWAAWATSIMEVGQEAFNFLNQNQQKYFEAQLFRIEQERDVAIAFAGDSAAAREEIERQYEEKRRAIQQKQAESERDLALFNIVVDTAQGILATIAQVGFPGAVPLVAVIGAIGAAQAALVASQPIPEFFRGTDNAPEGWALVDEKTPEVHTDSKGNIKSFGEDKANMRYLDRGDKIYKTRELFFNKELNNVLGDNDILPYSQMFDLVAPTINLDGGISKDDFRKEIRSMTSKLMSKETSVVNLDKKGFTSSIMKENATAHKMNNVLRLKGGIV